MRVTDRANARLLMQALQELKSKQNSYLNEMSSGKSINRPSDNPIDENRTALLKARIEKLSRYQKTYTTMKSTISMYDSILNEVTTSLQSAFQKGSEAASSTSSAGNRQIIASELKQIRDHILSLANTNTEGQYLFSGTLTDRKPFILNSGNDMVTYQGNNQTISVEIASSHTMEKNLPGNQVFLDTGIFNSLTDLIHATENNNQSGIQSSLGEMSNALDNLSVVRDKNGSKLETIESVNNYLKEEATNFLSEVSELEDADMASVISDLSLNKTAMDALFSAIATTGRNSLFNYIV